jgi:hypothetical protein
MLIYKDGIVDEVRRFFPNTSFPTSGPSDEFLAENEAYRVNTFKPHDQRTQKVVSCDPYVEDGWAYTVAVEDKTQEELDADTQSQASKVRADRNRRLSETDWTQGKDIPASISDPWADYRQQLREVPDQEGFPWDVIWPEQPS